jgi:thiol-disulfide isomerase/thioredoxin
VCRARGAAPPARAIALAVGLTSVAGCDGKQGEPPPSSNRSEAVTARPGGSTTHAPSTHAAVAAAPQAPRALCVGQEARPAPRGALKTEAAPGAPGLPASPSFGVGKWVWVNLWAAWCGPCKEEMPRLVGWQQKLSAAGVLLDLAFVSLDDDERQLQRFLEAQPATGVRASYWLPDGSQRSAWLAALGVKDSPELPVHALVAPSGQIACVIHGAVEERDYATIAAFVGARR